MERLLGRNHSRRFEREHRCMLIESASLGICDACYRQSKPAWQSIQARMGEHAIDSPHSADYASCLLSLCENRLVSLNGASGLADGIESKRCNSSSLSTGATPSNLRCASSNASCCLSVLRFLFTRSSPACSPARVPMNDAVNAAPRGAAHRILRALRAGIRSDE